MIINYIKMHFAFVYTQENEVLENKKKKQLKCYKYK